MEKSGINQEINSIYPVPMVSVINFFTGKEINGISICSDFSEWRTKDNKMIKVPRMENFEKDKLSKDEIIEILAKLDISIKEFENFILSERN